MPLVTPGAFTQGWPGVSHHGYAGPVAKYLLDILHRGHGPFGFVVVQLGVCGLEGSTSWHRSAPEQVCALSTGSTCATCGCGAWLSRRQGSDA
jgi:hypothetical protein